MGFVDTIIYLPLQPENPQRLFHVVSSLNRFQRGNFIINYKVDAADSKQGAELHQNTRQQLNHNMVKLIIGKSGGPLDIKNDVFILMLYVKGD
uniref:Uncharacterized protein n=1 Tax=Anguilla anguilla TaxID=7936 RepID=A0A0E9UVR9_ANGAN